MIVLRSIGIVLCAVLFIPAGLLAFVLVVLFGLTRWEPLWTAARWVVEAWLWLGRGIDGRKGPVLDPYGRTREECRLAGCAWEGED